MSEIACRFPLRTSGIHYGHILLYGITLTRGSHYSCAEKHFECLK
ncbi:rCG49103 [Rattus norvegicus]|uniref:RCG49103 n=1 Tax=Rattus norvegicus TaxID=10116 RepID=A6IGY3_RAT|nr:rCG49103 [Rattus norvegicus]